VLSKETLQRSIEEAIRAIRSREEDVGAARRRLAEAERELKLLTELAQIRGIELPDAARSVGAGTAESASSRPAGQAVGRLPSRSKSALLNAVFEILSAQGEPMQIQDLMAAVRERQVAIPGQGVQANLIAYISRDSRIVRPRRGYYGLAEWGLEDAKPKPKRKRRRRSGAAR
jgi:Rad3-related DNA helicase